MHAWGLLFSELPLPSRRTQTDMKLGLLLVLVVAALLPDLSESRIVSKCELKDKLHGKIYLPKNLRKHEEEIMSIVICEISEKSNMNTSLVKVEGIRQHLTTDMPTTDGYEEVTEEAMTAAPTARAAPTTTTTITTTTPTFTTAAPTTSTTAPGTEAVSSQSSSTSVRRRKKRNDPYEYFTLHDMENLFDEDQMEQDDEHLIEYNLDEDVSSSQRYPNGMPLWSLGFYGIFQLRDSHFCDSGYRWSRNLCQKSCSDFTDDDITDDIECLIKSYYHWYLFQNISLKCYRERKTFLQDCS
ncbi:PREDICTED: uncharacterized protein LOC107100361 isoform X2 [Cyprinodon variegatus]|uniref:uncharacterized protein LOC107100361 isoform X2 n=1 Tax=Cyprinodon variegatus TaxID=28743 RepID=UPI00074277CE|nr:PREDICTED: uncharacterized protein LOC107100361 isoform X2 [Cyprinodon variegatus]